ncbi:MAG: ABC transporter permease [Thermomicrobiales bacterium]|nr:ABC transporter permease [Thermomicrobiales bacterium]
MSFTILVLKNLLRQRTRSALTILGIAIGITTVVALGVIADGLKATSGEIINAGGADFMVGQKGAADLTFSTVTTQEWDALATVPGVERAVGVALYIKRVGDNPYFVAIGIEPEQLATTTMHVVEGERFPIGATDQIMIGARAASELKLGIGDVLTISDRDFQITGIYQTGNVWQDNGAYVPLATVQQLSGRTGVVTMVYVSIAEDADQAMVAQAIEDAFPQLATIQNTEDYGEVDQGMQLIDAANLAISLLAVGIGAIGVTNTMVMSVFERTREIGILRSVGWRGARIFRMIVGESLLLCMVAAVVGTLLGVLAVQGVMLIEAIGGLLEPAYSLDIIFRAVIVAFGVALAGAAYPAVRAVRLTPMEALRHE